MLVSLHRLGCFSLFKTNLSSLKSCSVNFSSLLHFQSSGNTIYRSYLSLYFPGGSAVKNPPAIAGDKGSIPGSGRSPGEGNGNPLQYSCLGSPMDRAWRATLHRVSRKSRTRLSDENNKATLTSRHPQRGTGCLCWG